MVVSEQHATSDADHRKYGLVRGKGIPMVLINGSVDGLQVPSVSAGVVMRWWSLVLHQPEW